MRFKIDENLPIEVAEALRQVGHDAATVLEQQHGGSADAQLATLCQHESRVLVTLDMDFADIRNYPPAEFPGLIVLRLRQQDKLRVECLDACDTSASPGAT
jgi:predicted nuclease of predicted toxin-antitoxin system